MMINSAAPNGERSLRYMKQTTQAVVLAVPVFWVLRFAICITVWVKLILFEGKKRRRQDKRRLWSHCIRATPVRAINRARICSVSCWDIPSYQSRWHPQQCISLSASPTPTTHDCSYCSCFPPPALILGEAPPHTPCSCSTPLARL